MQAGVASNVHSALTAGSVVSRVEGPGSTAPDNGAGAATTIGVGSVGGTPRFAESAAIEPPGKSVGPRTLTIAPGMTMAEIERAAIQAALAETNGNRRKAAAMLGIGERTMYRKLREYDIPVR